MKPQKKKLVLVGVSGTANVILHDLRNPATEVAGFAVERKYLTEQERFGLPVVPLEEIEQRFPPDEHEALVTISCSRLNRNRARIFEAIKTKGYKCANHVSPDAILGPQVQLGENIIIMPGAQVQYGCQIGDDTIIWSGVTVLHETVVGSHVVINANTIIAGECKIGDYCIFGVGSSAVDGLEIGQDCTVGAGSVVVKNLAANTFIRPQKMFVKEDASREFWENR
ncbi:MAG: NeuD/PglB/VioB family sugar acetyltransferase [Betaproteobacteria bacterium]|nr:NeuD/PglB/VioB family sugar acetyltransferase [Betaproteobacteria bacterium]